MKGKILLLLALISILFSNGELWAQLTPQQAVVRMGRGINIGNTLEPPTEGGWNNPVLSEYYFDDYAVAGFKTVRIPITWNGHTSTASPYKIDAAWLDRVEQIVDWGLKRKLFIVINAHHESWLKDKVTQENLDRLDSIWSQISLRLRNKSDSLLFEMLNEPYPMQAKVVDDLNARVLKIIRKTNPTRIVIFSGNQWSGCTEMVQAAVPTDNYMMGYFHSYDPYLFGLKAEGTWGTASDVNYIKSIFDKAATWSTTNKIPVFIGEFGAISQYGDPGKTKLPSDYNSRTYHYATYVEQALTHNIAFAAWEDGGDFQLYYRSTHKWNEIKDILINFSEKNPTQLLGGKASGTSVSIKWTNRATDNDSIFILRGYYPDDLKKIASLSANVSEYIDEKPLTGDYTYYKVTAHYNNATAKDLMSYPIRVPTAFILGVEKPEEADLVIGYPNPANEYIMINLPGNEQDATISIYTLGGKLIKESRLLNNKSKVSLEGLKAGVYLINIKTSKSLYSKKIIKN